MALWPIQTARIAASMTIAKSRMMESGCEVFEYWWVRRTNGLQRRFPYPHTIFQLTLKQEARR
jgi:hypothetical protein